MNTDGDPGIQEAAVPTVRAPARPGTTTLYELIEAIAGVVPDALVVPTVVHLLRARRIHFLRRAECRIVVL